MLTGLLALMILIIRLFPETPLARTLHFHLVELPVRLAQRLKRRDIIVAVIFLCSIQSFAMIGAADLAIVYAAEMSVYVDAALAAYLATLAMRVRNFGRHAESSSPGSLGFGPGPGAAGRGGRASGTSNRPMTTTLHGRFLPKPPELLHSVTVRRQGRSATRPSCPARQR